jgi:MoxR-like ATPase
MCAGEFGAGEVCLPQMSIDKDCTFEPPAAQRDGFPRKRYLPYVSETLERSMMSKFGSTST